MSPFETWLVANGYDVEEMKKPENATQRRHLEAAWEKETKPAKPPEKTQPESVDDKLKLFEVEAERQHAITTMADEWAAAHTHDPEKIRQLRELRDTARNDKKVTVNEFKLTMFRFDKTGGPMILTPRKPEQTAELMEAGICMAGQMERESLEKYFSKQTLESADKEFKGSLGLQATIAHCARRNGWNGFDFKSNWYQAVKAAFRGHTDEAYAATTGPSTYSLPNILANVANKFLRVGFMAVEDTWSRISARRNFNDFKTATTVSLTGGMLFKKVPPSGELKHGTMGETVYTNKADTYGVILGIDRQSLINDDLGALTTASRRIGRGAALKINDIFWSTFLNNSTFFAAGNNNVISGGTSVLSSGGLKLGDQKFRVQNDPDGFPMAATPAILLVPPTLAYTGRELMNSSFLVGTTTADALKPSSNIFQGSYRLETSVYMENSSYTGNSTTAWYILADPNDVPVVEIGFLNGQESPTVESEAMEFNMLGIALRGYHDFGVSLQEFRGGIRSAGA